MTRGRRGEQSGREEGGEEERGEEGVGGERIGQKMKKNKTCKIEGAAQRKQTGRRRDGERDKETERSLWKIWKVDIKCRLLLEGRPGLWFSFLSARGDRRWRTA